MHNYISHAIKTNEKPTTEECCLPGYLQTGKVICVYEICIKKTYDIQ